VARVFVSHASDDLALVGEVHRWLVEDGQEGTLSEASNTVVGQPAEGL
jgi:hypothetical protein